MVNSQSTNLSVLDQGWQIEVLHSFTILLLNHTRFNSTDSVGVLEQGHDHTVQNYDPPEPQSATPDLRHKALYRKAEN